MKVNKLVSLTLVIVMLISIIPVYAQDAAVVNIVINEDTIVFSDKTGYPFVDSNNRTQVPFRVTLEQFGAEVDWDSENRVAIAKKGNIEIKVPIGESFIYKNEQQIKNDTAALIKDSRTYLPIRAVLEAFGATVSWDAASKSVIATTSDTETNDTDTTVLSKMPSLKIGVYTNYGVDSQKVNALCTAFAKMGHQPMAISAGDLINGRLTHKNFDVLVLPAGNQGEDSEYIQEMYLTTTQSKIRNYVKSGGGVIAIETGARLICDSADWLNKSVSYNIDLYDEKAIGPIDDIGQGMGKIKITDENFGVVDDEYTTYIGLGASYFNTSQDATVFAEYSGLGKSDGKPAILGFQYKSGGYVCLVGPNLELEETSETDWTVWDNLQNSFYDPESELPLLAKLVEYANSGTMQSQTDFSDINNQGKRIALYSVQDLNGGAWSSCLPAIAKSIEKAGHTPIAITDIEIKNGLLTTDNFDAIVFPGGYSYGYKTQLKGHESKITDFINNGGGCLAICAGSFYLSTTVKWLDVDYPYDVNVYTGTAEGPINDIAAWPTRQFTSMQVNDAEFGLDKKYSVTYYGGPFFHDGQEVSTLGSYSYSGKNTNSPAAIKFTYGAGKVVMFGPHPELEEGTTNDWCWWDDYRYASTESQKDPDSEWDILDVCYDWITSSSSSKKIASAGITLGVEKTSKDTTEDSIGDAQRKDGLINTADQKPNDMFYTVKNGKTMELTGFGQGISGSINSVTLKVNYSVQDGSSCSNYIQWSTDGINYNDTTIQPVSGDNAKEGIFDLKAAGIDTMSELENLRILYNNNTSGTQATVFDYVHVIVTTN